MNKSVWYVLAGVFGMAVVLGILSQFTGPAVPVATLAPMPAAPTAGFFPPWVRTWTNTYLPYVLLATGVLITLATYLLWSHKVAYLLGTAFLAGALLYVFAPAPNCDPYDRECVVIQADKEHQQLEAAAQKAAAEARAKAGVPASSTAQKNICNGVQRAVTLTSAPKVINPLGQCSPIVWHEGHCIYVWQAGKTADSDKVRVCHHPNEPDPKKQYDKMPVDAERFATADTEFDTKYQLSPPNYTQFFR